MDFYDIKTRRELKGNKSRKNKELNGKYSSKHIRISMEKKENLNKIYNNN
jgi:hypothetical protein